MLRVVDNFEVQMTDSELEPIPPEEAKAILEGAIRERLGDDWDDEESGWSVVTSHQYMARLTKGRVNLDFYVDIMGNVTVEEKEINPAQDSGRLIAWMFLLVSLGLALMIARAIGWI
jgi:hypothetical protein